MGLFNSTCCPPKPRRTIDYILNWIDKYGPIITKDTSYINDLLDWRRTVEDDLDGYVKNAADEYITNYDWSQVPELDAKADKVKNAVLGHLASIDANGNLVDSGSGVDEAIEQGNMDLATCNAVYTALQGFAPSIHYHSEIKAPGAFANYAYAKIQLGASSPVFQLKVGGANDMAAQVEVNVDNIENLKIALKNPSTTPEDDATKLITSKAVYDALSNISPMGIYTVNYSSVSSENDSISIANSTAVGAYNSFVAFISDNSGRIVSIFLTKASPSKLSCLATLVIGEEETDHITGNSYWGCKLMIGNMKYECNVHDDTEANSTFALQS